MPKSAFVVVMFGDGWGTQLAEVLGPAVADGRIPVRKWRAQGKKWTGRTLVEPSRIVREDALLLPRHIADATRAGAFEDNDNRPGSDAASQDTTP